MYSLYHTLKVNISEEELSSKEIRVIEGYIDTMLDDDIEAVLMLIFEHARIHEEYVYSPKNLKDLPYGMTYANQKLNMNVKNLPVTLQWIIHKFCKQRISVKKNEK